MKTLDADEPGWELYRSFLGVLTEGSLSAAARALGLAQPTLGRHIDALEQALGVVLFTRSQQGFAPTEAALNLQPYAQTLASTTAALRRAAASQGDGVQGTVRISASEVVGVEVLPPILAGLRDQHPGLTIELAITNRVEDLLRREADIAVRMLRPAQEALVARRVGAIELGLYAHADYIARHGLPRNEAELAKHALIGFDQETPFLRSLKSQLSVLRRSAFCVRTDSDLGQLAAIRAGLGIGGCQVALAGRDTALVRVLPRQFAPSMETWVTMHEDLRGSARCQATFDALVAGLERYLQPQAATPRARTRR